MESCALRFLYKTKPGRVVLKLLISPPVSKIAGAFLDSKLSKSLIPKFIKSYKIKTEGVIEPENGFQSFNEFFCRKRVQDKICVKEGELISPCDAFLTSIKIKNTTVLDVKHTKFTIGQLLHDESLAREYKDGYALIFRLTPSHYHRYCFAADGIITKNRRINGVLHCVRPIATATVPVFAQNSREYQLIKTSSFGNVVQMEVGAMLVGRIVNDKKYSCGSRVKAGHEKGYFEYGGSTIILLVKKNVIKLAKEYNETIVAQGEVIANIFS